MAHGSGVESPEVVPVRLFKQAVKRCLGAIGLAVARRRSAPEELWFGDEEFLNLVSEVQGRTLVPPDRLFFIYQFARHARSLAGDVGQVGVYKGGTAKLIARLFSATNKTIHLFDTFSGMPAPDPQKDNLAYVREAIFSDTSLDEVREYLRDCGNVLFYKGTFPETAGPIRDRQFCFVYVDADLYQSTRGAIEFFYPRMVPSGVIVFDDYDSRKCPGVRRAVDEFLADKREAIVRMVPCQALLIKRQGRS